jgi:DNA-binding NtrC family response regulator
MTTPTQTEPLNVLVIDDQAAMRDLLLQILAPEGHLVVAVDSAEEGLAQLPYTRFDVALLDQHLPGMEGFVLGEYLRRNNPHMEIALVTGTHDARLERLAREQGLWFIPKPFEVGQILDVMSAYRAKAKEREATQAAQADPDHAPPLSRYVGELAEVYAMPAAPTRVEERLVQQLRESLRSLKGSKYTERERVIALSGLLAARVLGLKLPRNAQGETLYEEYDARMREHGRRPEFETR